MSQLRVENYYREHLATRLEYDSSVPAQISYVGQLRYHGKHIIQYLFRCTIVQYQYAMGSTIDGEFPSSLRALFPSRVDPTEFHLGTHAHDLRFAVVMDAISRKRSLFVLYDGSTDNGSVLVKVGKTHNHLTTYNTGVKAGDTTTTLTYRTDDARVYRFSLDLRGSRPEKFEWRPTEGNEVHAMFDHAKGFKLVRLRSKGPGNGKGGKRAERHIDETSDGKEVVAVWATQRNILMRFVPTLKPFKFELRASGKTGELGDDFAYVALATALKIWSFEAQGISGLPLMESLVS
ncbi:uncharacterized protein F4812DRAFT_38188 [Daldinia caldariorum]|uniref:uncharacterized protein n=1 Tax=Daldinia caldariorum TaxID=326644 RepID=UPI0020081E98|nr:uncharacterized protein F4812DRAFT_38188 [Daldinia caldariorum]KAI1473075.1 hypothetical protein F4812DRAFT_38188 [Daldinia caldariorum]